MAEEKEIRLKKVLEDMSFSLNHIEDVMADDRALLVKLVKQNNTIVEFLRSLEMDIDEQYKIEAPPSFGDDVDREKRSEKRMSEVKELLEDFKAKSGDLQEFEEELKKHKDQLTPGMVGES